MQINNTNQNFNNTKTLHAKRNQTWRTSGNKPDSFIRKNNQPSMNVSFTGKLKNLSKISDIFTAIEKSNLFNISEIIKAEEKLKKELLELYDKIFDKLSEEIPFIKEINMPKPELVFDNLSVEPASMGYQPAYNNIKINLGTLKDTKFAYKESENKLLTYIRLSKEMNDLMKKGELEDYIVREFTDEDIKFVFNASIPHEIRHAVQFHLLYHDPKVKKDGLLDIFKNNIIDNYKKQEKELTPEKLEEIIGTKYPYIYNYNPNKLFDNLTLDSPGKIKGKNAAFSAKDHFLKGFENILKGYKNLYKRNSCEPTIEYYANPIEIDAYAFGADFLQKNKELVKNYDDKLKQTLDDVYTNSTKKGLEALEKYGYPPPIIKD